MVKLILAFREMLMSLAHNELIQITLYSNSNTASEHAPQVEGKISIVYAKRSLENHRGPAPDKKYH